MLRFETDSSNQGDFEAAVPAWVSNSQKPDHETSVELCTVILPDSDLQIAVADCGGQGGKQAGVIVLSKQSSKQLFG